MENLLVASLLRELAERLRAKGEQRYKVRAYLQAAALIQQLDEPVRAWVESRRHVQAPGIGPAIGRKLEDWAKTGSIPKLKALRAEASQAAGSAAAPPGALGQLRLGEAARLTEALLAHLRLPGVRAEAAGSVRRGEESADAFDLVVAGPPAAVAAARGALERLDVVRGGTRGTPACAVLRLSDGRELRMWSAPPEAFGTVWHWATGSAAHLAALRAFARGRGFDLSEAGLVETATGRPAPCADEADLFARLGLDFIPPELRSGAGEIEAAAAGTLPNLVQPTDVRGDLHAHTNWSDGEDDLLAMAEAAEQRGYAYLAICDHSRALGFAGGLDAVQLRRQGEAIAQVNGFLAERGRAFRLLRGVEVDILADGRLDLPDALLAELDVVVASIHSGFRQPETRLTERLIKAMQSEHVDIIGHPTGRLIGRREPYALNWDRLFAAAAETGTALEVNASPARLDLRDTLVRQALAAGVRLSVDTDAHRAAELGFMPFGITMARRGWAQANDLLNTRTPSELAELGMVRRARQ